MYGIELLPTEISFEAWISHIFDHDDPDWHWKADGPLWDEEAEPQRTLEFLNRLFESPEFLLSRFSADQIGAGLNCLANPGCSSYGFVFLQHSLPIEERTRCLKNIATIYETVLAKICMQTTHHDEKSWKPGHTVADYVCYMFWDVFPMFGRTRNHQIYTDDVKQNLDEHCQIEAACLDAMERTLAIDHIACQEGALHGLGHWQMFYPERVVPIIDRYLASNLAKPELTNYAQNARTGSVL
ncbi:hypothetical protein MCEMSE15_01506 [Fimbriimonadaceae bacterium]